MAIESKDKESIQSIIGYRFRNPDLLEQAFIRRSYSEENGGENNEVLEFIGDKALDLAVIRVLTEKYGEIAGGGYYSRDPKQFKTEIDEGWLTNLKQKIVQKQSLARNMSALGFHNYLYMSEGDVKNNVQEQDSVKEDLFEAIIGAVTLDCNWDMAKITAVVKQMVDFDAFFNSDEDDYDNYVGKVQEWFQANGNGLPDYKKSGVYMDGTVVCSLSIPGTYKSFQERGTSFHKAKKAVAKEAFEYLLRSGLIPNPYIEAVGEPDKDNILQQINELQQKKLIPAPVYEFDKGYDLDGNPDWLSEVYVDGIGELFIGSDSSKKAAQRECAYELLDYIIDEYTETGKKITELDLPKVYRYKVYYDRFPKSQWRNIEILSNNSVAKFCYTVFASFNTMGYHEFGVLIDEDGEKEQIEFEDLRDMTLEDLNETEFTIIYDFGTEQYFHVSLTKELGYTPGTANQYPKIVAGKGKGILDDVSSDEYEVIVSKIKKGNLKYKYTGISEKEEPWDPDDYSAEADNSTVRTYVRNLAYNNEYNSYEG